LVTMGLLIYEKETTKERETATQPKSEWRSAKRLGKLQESEILN
jgi:hypothetical protein